MFTTAADTTLIVSFLYFLVFIVLGLLWLGYKDFKRYGPKMFKRHINKSLLEAYMKSNGSTNMMARFITDSESPDYERRISNGSHAIDKMLRDLDHDKLGEFKVTVGYRFCDIKQENCDVVLSLEVASGEFAGRFFYMNFETRKHSLYDSKDRLQYEMKDFNIEDLEYKSNDRLLINTCHNVNIIYPIDIPSTAAAIKNIESAIEGAIMSEKYYVDVDPELHTSMYYIHDDGKNLRLYSRFTTARNLSPDEIDALYAPIEVSIANEKHFILPSDMVEIMANNLYRGQNVFSSGIMGTGKTSFMQLVMHRLNQLPGVRIVNVLPSHARALNDLRAQSQLINELTELSEMSDNPVIVMYFDESEQLMEKSKNGIHSGDNVFLASILDGEYKQMLNLASALTFNADESELNPILFRPGRCSLHVTLRPLSKEQAPKAVQVLKMNNVGKVFDEPQFNHTVDVENFLVDGKRYAKKGEITLADITGCFRETDSNTLLIEAIRNVSLGVKRAEKSNGPKVKLRTMPNVKPQAKLSTTVHDVIREKLKENN